MRRLIRSSGGRLRLWPLLLFAVFFAGYYLMHQEEVPVTGRTQLIDLSREQEAALGLQSYREIMSQSDVVPSGDAVDTVRAVGRRLAAVAEDPGFNWEFNVIDSDQVNAFALPGGKVAVYTGLLPVAGNEDALAVVMGHEIAHAIARHGAERMAHEKLAQFGALAVGVAVGTQYGILMPFSRKHESEADYIGLMYVARACFDPTEAPALWERMAKAGGSAPAEFLSTHPNPETRIANFAKWMPEALAVREQHCSASGN